MKNTSHNNLTKLFVVAAISVGAFAACTDNGDNKTGDKMPASQDTLSAAASTTSNYSSKDSASKDSMSNKTAANSAGMTKKKHRTSIMMPGDNTEKMMMDKEGVYNKATVMPQFPGGQDALNTYVNSHVDYPQQAIDGSDTGTVRVSFVVDENGKVKDAHSMSSKKVGNGLDEEAVRVINNMPSWKPGKVNGKSVKTRLELPINFQLEG